MPHKLLAVATLLLAPPVSSGAEDVATLLKSADRYRSGAESLQVETELTVLGSTGAVEKERRYTVLVRPQRQSLVIMRSPAEAGQKVLMLGDDFWLLMPGSQRPLRITAAQKLLGEASTGDIATMTWADDYGGSVLGAEPCPGAAGRTCWHLSLQAQRKGVTYQRMELWLGTKAHEPVAAELYLRSDKLAKQARFSMDSLSRPTRVEAMELQDRLASDKLTRIRYLSRLARDFPDNWFSPAFLTRSPVLE